MRIAEISMVEISGALGQPVGSPARHQSLRNGLVLRLTDVNGAYGLGEASPLPGYSSDSLANCRAALEALDTASLNAGLGRVHDDIPQKLAIAADLMSPSAPAARFALEMALLDLECQRRQASPFDLLNRPARGGLSVNALVDASRSDVLEAAQRCAAQGFGTLKVKLGKDPAHVVAKLQLVAAKTGLALRADANRGLGPAEAENLLPQLAELNIEFLEEPCVPDAWAGLPLRRPPLALDESLMGATRGGLAAMVRQLVPRVLVLKPMALGGMTRCLQLADCARELGLEVVVTHLFDGPLAHRAASVLALMLQSGQLAAGLARHAGLDAWPAADLALDREIRLDPSKFAGAVSPPDYWRALSHGSIRRL